MDINANTHRRWRVAGGKGMYANVSTAMIAVEFMDVHTKALMRGMI